MMASDIRNLILYSLGVLFISRWLILKKGMDHRFHEECNAGCKRQENGVPERPASESIALDKQPNLNCDFCSFHFTMVPFYELYFLKIILPIRNKKPPLSETEPPFSQTLPLQLFDFYLVYKYMLRLRS
jgi:hypothetical protein